MKGPFQIPDLMRYFMGKLITRHSTLIAVTHASAVAFRWFAAQDWRIKFAPQKQVIP